MNEPLKIAIAGLGTVGAETVKVIHNQADVLSARAGRPITVTAVSARDQSRDRGINLEGIQWFDDAEDMAGNADADVVAELIGGSEGIAKAVCETALGKARHVVTANKALLAHHGFALARMAEQSGVSLQYEAAVAGGIPIIKSLREGLAANDIKRISGILNGTSNYIMSRMREENLDFETILQDAQDLGYAEADPSFDIDGVDAAHKLAILASVAFGSEINFDAVYTEGIRHISLMDVQFADELGYRIKLLGIAARNDSGGAPGIEQRVHPCLVPKAAAIANVEHAFNAVEVECTYADTIIHVGPGAGAGPTASAVIADIIDIARGHHTPVFGVPTAALKPIPTLPMAQHSGAYYVRLMVVDRPGVFADIATILRDHAVSMESVLQRGRAPGEPVPLVMTVHETLEANMNTAFTEIAALDAVVGKPCLIRIELLPG